MPGGAVGCAERGTLSIMPWPSGASAVSRETGRPSARTRPGRERRMPSLMTARCAPTVRASIRLSGISVPRHTRPCARPLNSVSVGPGPLQWMIWPDEFEVGVADDLLFVEGTLRVLRADLAVLTFERLKQFMQVRRNAADLPHTCAAFHRRDGAAEQAIGFEEEVLDVFRQQAVLFALLHVGHECAHVNIARGE
jgi:hypothetical protein